MAATVKKQRVITSVPYQIEETYYSTLVPGATITHTHTGPDGVAPYKVECVVTNPTASGDPIFIYWDESLNDTTNDYVYFKFDTVPGGDLTDGEVKVLIYWLAQASGAYSA